MIILVIYLLVQIFDKEPVHNEVLKGIKEDVYELTY